MEILEKIIMNDLTWTCHICGEERPDDKIDVLSYLIEGLPGAERNVGYCNDKEECRKGAEEKAKTHKV